jgi:hypothetical protein
MKEVIHKHSARISDEYGTVYEALVCGERREDGTWQGWLEFHPKDGTSAVLRTPQETSQPNRSTIEYWATGLEPIYIEGALARARGKLL